MDFGTWLPSAEFLRVLINNPVLIAALLLTLAGVFVNGWTDAPNAIATCIGTRCMRPKAALLMSAFFDFAGVFVMTVLSGKVAGTIAGMLNFGSDKGAMIALLTGLIAAEIWAILAWGFGLPSSESHSLIAGITGAAIAACGGLSGINFGEWQKVIYGLFMSIGVGLILGFVYTKMIRLLFARADRRRVNKGFKVSQIGAAAFTSFMHGAQDGQKFVAVFLIAAGIATGQETGGEFAAPYWMSMSVAIVMFIGVALCGVRIIKSIGMDMVKMERYEAFSADFAGATCVMVATLTGLPISTSHAKTAAIMGTGASKRLSNVNWSVSLKMVYSWFLVFPFCGLIGFGLTWIALRVF